MNEFTKANVCGAPVDSAALHCVQDAELRQIDGGGLGGPRTTDRITFSDNPEILLWQIETGW
jgi:hypothetical protein